MEKLRQLTQKEKLFTTLKCVGISARTLTTNLGVSRMAFNMPAVSPYIDSELWEKIEDYLGFRIRTGYEALTMDYFIGDKIKALLYLNDMNNTILAKEIGRSLKDVNDKLAGNSDLRIDILKDIAKVLELEFVFGFKGRNIDDSPMKDKLQDIVKEHKRTISSLSGDLGLAQQTMSVKTREDMFTMSEIKKITDMFDEKFECYFIYGRLKVGTVIS